MRLPMRLRTILIALAVVIVSFAAIVAPGATNRLAELPPLPPS
jgi:hypothetical protein